MTKQQFISFSLPFKLVCQVTDKKNFKEVTKLAVLAAVYVDGQVSFFDTVESSHGFSSVMPILRPLSEADTIIRTEFSKRICGKDHDSEVIDLFSLEHTNTSDLLQDITIDNLPFDSVLWLIKNHFDIGRFVEKGEAIETNDLPSFSYDISK
jgi:hypothetical protein